MYWKTWIKEDCPSDWTNEEVYDFIKVALRKGVMPTIEEIANARK